MDLIEVERVEKTKPFSYLNIHSDNTIVILYCLSFIFRVCVVRLRENALDRLWSVPEGPCDCVYNIDIFDRDDESSDNYLLLRRASDFLTIDDSN